MTAEHPSLPVRRALPIIRVFVSSTFSDLKHERNALHAQVWPELERYCQQRGFTFQAIDLRWGVPAEAGLDHRTMRICFEELRRSQDTSPEPNFLILLGNRYGWRPLPEVISVEEFEKLKTAAQQIQSAPPDPAEQLSDEQVTILKKAVAVLEDWYLLDENAKPFGDKTLLGEYVLRTRKTLLRGVDYGKETVGNNFGSRSRETSDRTLTSSATTGSDAGPIPKQPDATGKLQDTPAWVDVQFVLWSIVNFAFPAADLAGRFQTQHETSPGTVPSSVRFQASATEQEIWQGALQVENADRHVIAAVREIVDLDAFPNRPRRGDFIDLKDDGTPDADSRQAVTDLKAELERRLSRSPIIRSTCQLAIDQDNNPTGDVTTSHLDDFCREILDRFKSIIIEQINAYWGCDLSADDATLAQVRGSQQELDLECADHLRFAGERAPEKTFVGRESELQRIRDYLHSKTNQPFVVHGPSGSGKTALLGKIIQEMTPARSADGTRAKTGPIVLSRFIGTTPESSNLRSLLSSLCRELRQDFEMNKTRKTPDGQTEIYSPPLPTDLNELIDEFYAQLGKATAARPVIVFLDALDQLDAAGQGRSAFWIRSALSSTTDASCHVRMVVSCLSPSDEFPEDSEACEPFRDLRLRTLLSNRELGALEENEARELFARWLHGAERSVSETQQDMIWSAMQKSPACRQPLFLKVLFEEAKLWRSYDPDVRLNEPETSNDYVGALLKQMFDRLGLEVNHGKLLVECALGYIAAARRGLSETEILEVLFADPDYKKQLDEMTQRNNQTLPTEPPRIPIAIWSRLRSDLAAYLTERAAPGGNVVTLYHRQVAEWIKARFVNQASWSPHERLAEYFTMGRGASASWNSASIRGLDELPYQLMQAREIKGLEVIAMTDFFVVKSGRFDQLDVLYEIRDVTQTLAQFGYRSWHALVKCAFSYCALAEQVADEHAILRQACRVGAVSRVLDIVESEADPNRKGLLSLSSYLLLKAAGYGDFAQQIFEWHVRPLLQAESDWASTILNLTQTDERGAEFEGDWARIVLNLTQTDERRAESDLGTQSHADSFSDQSFLLWTNDNIREGNPKVAEANSPQTGSQQTRSIPAGLVVAAYWLCTQRSSWPLPALYLGICLATTLLLACAYYYQALLASAAVICLMTVALGRWISIALCKARTLIDEILEAADAMPADQRRKILWRLFRLHALLRFDERAFADLTAKMLNESTDTIQAADVLLHAVTVHSALAEATIASVLQSQGHRRIKKLFQTLAMELPSDKENGLFRIYAQTCAGASCPEFVLPYLRQTARTQATFDIKSLADVDPEGLADALLMHAHNLKLNRQKSMLDYLGHIVRPIAKRFREIRRFSAGSLPFLRDVTRRPLSPVELPIFCVYTFFCHLGIALLCSWLVTIFIGCFGPFIIVGVSIMALLLPVVLVFFAASFFTPSVYDYWQFSKVPRDISPSVWRRRLAARFAKLRFVFGINDQERRRVQETIKTQGIVCGDDSMISGDTIPPKLVTAIIRQRLIADRGEFILRIMGHRGLLEAATETAPEKTRSDCRDLHELDHASQLQRVLPPPRWQCLCGSLAAVILGCVCWMCGVWTTGEYPMSQPGGPVIAFAALFLVGFASVLSGHVGIPDPTNWGHEGIIGVCFTRWLLVLLLIAFCFGIVWLGYGEWAVHLTLAPFVIATFLTPSFVAHMRGSHLLYPTASQVRFSRAFWFIMFLVEGSVVGVLSGLIGPVFVPIDGIKAAASGVVLVLIAGMVLLSFASSSDDVDS